MALPAQIINDRKSAVIIPAVFIKKPRIILNKCSTLQQCEYRFYWIAHLMIRSMKIIPKTRDELIDCYNRSVCSFFKGHANSHVFLFLLFHLAVYQQSVDRSRRAPALQSHLLSFTLPRAVQI